MFGVPGGRTHRNVLQENEVIRETAAIHLFVTDRCGDILLVTGQCLDGVASGQQPSGGTDLLELWIEEGIKRRR